MLLAIAAIPLPTLEVVKRLRGREAGGVHPRVNKKERAEPFRVLRVALSLRSLVIR
jgi:hypothetical protein